MVLSKLRPIAGERPDLRVRRGRNSFVSVSVAIYLLPLETHRTHRAPEQSLVCDTCRPEHGTMLENKYTQFEVIDRRPCWNEKFYKYLVITL